MSSFTAAILTHLTNIFPSETLYTLRRKWTDNKIIDSEMAPCIEVQRLKYRQGYNHGILIAEARQKHGLDITESCYKEIGAHPETMVYMPHYPTGVRDGMRDYIENPRALDDMQAFNKRWVGAGV